MSVTLFYEDPAVTIYHGEALQVLATIEDGTIDVVMTDPPYSSGGQFRGDRTQLTSTKYLGNSEVERPEFHGDTRDQRSYGYWCALWLSEALRVVKDGGICCVFTDWRQLPTTTDAMQAGGWVWRGIVPWDKTEAARPQKGRFRNQCEYVVWGSKGGLGNGEGRACLPGYYRYTVKQADKHHIAGKPTPLMTELLAIAPDGGVVLDPFMGSGSTLIAARARGLRCIGSEISAEYCRIATERLSQSVMPLFAGEGAA